MATPINSAALTGSKLDVANIVNQLMQVERQPITALQERLDTTGVRITALGSLQSKFSALRDAVQDLQTPSLFKRQSASSSAPGVLKAAASEAAVPGRYDVQVLALASASQFALVQGLNQSTSYRITTPVNGTSRSFDFVATSLTDLQAQVEAESALQGVLTVSLLDDRRGFLQGLQTGASNEHQWRGRERVRDQPDDPAELAQARLCGRSRCPDHPGRLGRLAREQPFRGARARPRAHAAGLIDRVGATRAG
jgi:flagellar hook-associated protein 2